MWSWAASYAVHTLQHLSESLCHGRWENDICHCLHDTTSDCPQFLQGAWHPENTQLPIRQCYAWLIQLRLLCRDTVQLYKQLYDSGLQYGPAFRLLRNVHIPDILEEPQASAVE